MRVTFRVDLAVGLSVLSLVLGACGGGGGSGSAGAANPPPATNADPGGIWTATEPSSGDTIEGVITEAGTARFINLSNGVQYVGTATTAANNISASYTAYAPIGTTFADGSTQATGTASGTISAGQSISATFDYTTSKGTSSSETLTFSYNSLYKTGSSLAAIAGNYTTTDGSTVSVTSSGEVTSQDPNTGCVLNGTISIINASYDVYDVSYTFSNCVGAAGVLNGSTAIGIGVLDTATTPTQAIIGVSNSSVGYVLSEVLPKQ